MSGILTALNQPDGQTPAALAADLEHMKNKVRELVRRGAMASASTMNYGQVNAFGFDSPAQPEQPNHKTGGTPGPGGLVLYLPFDKPDDNGVVHDESGAGNDGRVFGANGSPMGNSAALIVSALPISTTGLSFPTAIC